MRPHSVKAGVLVVSIGVLLGVLFFGAAVGDRFIDQLSIVSPSARAFRNRPNVLLLFGLLAGTASVVISYWLLSKRPFMFVSLWIIVLAFGDAKLGLIQQLSLVMRLSMMLTLVVFGVSVLFRTPAWAKEPLPLLFLTYLGLNLLHILFGGMTASELALLPIQLAVTIGILWGFRAILVTSPDFQKLAIAVVVAGQVITIVELLAIPLAPQPFLGGRLRAWHDLPTGFATGYVLLVITLLWAAVSSLPRLLRLASAVTGVIGIVLIILSGTRNAVLALIIAAGVMLVAWRRRLILPFVVLVTVISLAVVAFGGLEALFGQVGSRVTSVAAQETRFGVWGTAWRFIQEKPLWGYGLGEVPLVFSENLGQMAAFNAHSAYLGTWLRLGVGGVLVVLALYLMAMRRGWTLVSTTGAASDVKATGTLFLSLLMAVFVSGLFEDNLAGRGNIQQAIWGLAVLVLIVGETTLRNAHDPKYFLRQPRARG